MKRLASLIIGMNAILTQSIQQVKDLYAPHPVILASLEYSCRIFNVEMRLQASPFCYPSF